MGKFEGISDRGSYIAGPYGNAAPRLIARLRWQIGTIREFRLPSLQALIGSFYTALPVPHEAILLLRPVETRRRLPRHLGGYNRS